MSSTGFASTFDEQLEKYAEIIIRVGLNLQPGQRLLIGVSASFSNPGAPLEALPLVRIITRKAYEAGARYVDVIWDDQSLLLLRFQHAPRDSFEELSAWKAKVITEYGKRGDALLAISAQDPDLLSGQDQDLIAKLQSAAAKHYREVLEVIEKNETNWLVVGVPIPGWSAKVLPEIPPAERERRMWDLIFEMCRLNQPDPVAGWQEHIRRLQAWSKYLNHKQYTALKYNAPGTDLTIGLPKGHIWRSGSITNQNGITFTPNLPTEEVFTMPHKDKVEGTLTSTKPLSINGETIENFRLTFEAGRIVNAIAEKGETNLRNTLAMDEGASRLGEVALVPHSSPISKSNRLFYSILFDENASSHVALGAAYQFSMEGGEAMSEEAFQAAGGNQSLIHIDFMIGSGEMNVDGITTDNQTEPIMRAGEWVFEAEP
jgi:aminopeptidase